MCGFKNMFMELDESESGLVTYGDCDTPCNDLIHAQ